MGRIKIGINGFGRIGRQILRASFEHNDVKVVGINDPFADADYIAYLLKYDTIHGRFKGEIDSIDGKLFVNGNEIAVFNEKEPSNINWRGCGAKYIAEASGAFTTVEKVKEHIKFGGAKKVVITSPCEDAPLFVYGTNTDKYVKRLKVVSGASDATNCAAPLLKVINDKFGVVEGSVTSIHPMTTEQKIVDTTYLSNYKRQGRNAVENIIPTTSAASKEIGQIIPELNGKLTGISFCVPTADVGAVDLTLRLKSRATMGEIKQTIKTASETTMNGLIGYTEDAVVSSDFISDSRACIFDSTASMALNDNFVKLVAWYDNEWGYSKMTLDLLSFIGKTDKEQ